MAHGKLTPPESIYVIAGEASGDLLGESLIQALKKINPSIEIHGIGGERMVAQGLTSLFPMEELSIMGIVGILTNIISLRRRLKETIQDILTKKPRWVMTIDAPEFSLRVVGKLRRMRNRGQLDFPLSFMHEVAPTVWAWRPGRAKKMARLYDHLLCLYPMEPPLFEAHGLPATFIGHPIAESPLGDAKAFWSTAGLDSQAPLLCVLPGSRSSEIKTLLPIFSGVVLGLRKQNPGLQVVIPTLSKARPLVEAAVASWDIPPLILEGDSARNDAFAASTVALAASGTVALQLAHAGLPFVIAYKIGPISAAIARRLLITPWACMINILAGREIIPECIQDRSTVSLIQESLQPLFDASKAESQVSASQRVMETLKPPAPLSQVLKGILLFPPVGKSVSERQGVGEDAFTEDKNMTLKN